MLIWQAELGIESQRRFCRFFVGLSHSRFNRRARQLLPLIYLTRHTLNQEVDLSGKILIIDSFPVPVCQPVRNYRVKIFHDIADIGYKATKKVYYYGFKVHAIVSDDGYLLDYAVTKASVHDAKETVELVNNAHPTNHYLLGDEDFRNKLAQITLPTLLTVGEFDTMPLDAVRRMHHTLKNSRMVVTPDGGHCHRVDNPDAFFSSLYKVHQ